MASSKQSNYIEQAEHINIHEEEVEARIAVNKTRDLGMPKTSLFGRRVPDTQSGFASA